MSTSVIATTPSAFNENTGAISVAGSKVFIARERDFMEFIEAAPETEIHSLKSVLRAELTKLGESRSYVADLLRSRLRQVRNVMAHA